MRTIFLNFFGRKNHQTDGQVFPIVTVLEPELLEEELQLIEKTNLNVHQHCFLLIRLFSNNLLPLSLKDSIYSQEVLSKNTNQPFVGQFSVVRNNLKGLLQNRCYIL